MGPIIKKCENIKVQINPKHPDWGALGFYNVRMAVLLDNMWNLW